MQSPIFNGKTQPFTATGTYTDGSTKDVTTSSNWSSSTIAVATIDGAGLTTGVGAGTTVITANAGTISSSAVLTVKAVVQIGLTVTPAAVVIPKAGTQQFTAIANYNDGSTQDVMSSAIWSSSNANATISNSGLATAVLTGKTTITAQSGGFSGTSILTVALPQVVQVQPATGSEGYPRNGRVVVRFSEPIQPSVVSTGTLALLQGSSNVNGSLALSTDGLSLTFTPSQNLDPSALYTVVVQDGIGSQPTVEFQSTFTTGTESDVAGPVLVGVSPAYSATNVPLNAVIVAQTNKALDPATINGNTLLVRDGNWATVAGIYSISADGRTVNFVPSKPLARNMYHSVHTEGTITDLAGNPLSYGWVAYFTTGTKVNTSAPSVLGVSPVNGLQGVPINAQVVIQFSEPVDATTLSKITLSGGNGNTDVSGAMSNGNQTLTLIPLSALAANTAYMVSIGIVRDYSGNVSAAPVTTSFITGTDADASQPTVIDASIGMNATGVPTNSLVQLRFSKRINPLTVNSATFQVSPTSTGLPVEGTITVSEDGQTATLQPSKPLASLTAYTIYAATSISDLEGHTLPWNQFTSNFTTGQGTTTSAPTVVMVSPLDGMEGVPLNPQITVQLSAPAAMVSAGAIVLTANGTPTAGSISLSPDRTILTFQPSNVLAIDTTYTISIGTLTDQAGNQVTPFTSTFATGPSSVSDTTSPILLSVSPYAGMSRVDSNSSIILTFNEAINPLSLSENSIPVRADGFGGVLAGSYVLDATGTVVTFTPISPFPARTTIRIQGSVLDLSGNASAQFSSLFTTGIGGDLSPLAATVTPVDGATGVGLNASVVFRFSKSLNAGTINGNNFALMANGSQVAYSISTSADNRVVALTAGTLPAGTLVTVAVTGGIRDIGGNALAPMETQFTTANAFDTTHPFVVTQRPGNGATGVARNTSLVLYFNEAMNPATVAGALHVTQDGVVINGNTQFTSNGTAVQFTPAAPWPTNAPIQIFLDDSAQDSDGMSLTNYFGSFSTSPDLQNLSVTGVSPQGSAQGVPTNAVIDIEFNTALNPATVNSTTISLSPMVPYSVSLASGGTIIHLAPSTPLAANTSYTVQIAAGVLGANGLTLPSAQNATAFTTGAGADTIAPTVLSVLPQSGSTNVGTNVPIRVKFSKPISPLTVNASTIQITGGGAAVVPDSISFGDNNRSVLLTPHTPHTPLPDATLMTITISGVMDPAGNAVAPQTTQFTTGVGPDLAPPIILSTNPPYGATNVPLNAVMLFHASEPLDPESVNRNTFGVVEFSTWPWPAMAGKVSLSGDGQTITFVPDALLVPGRTYEPYSNGGVFDLAGNPLPSSVLSYFTAGTTTDTPAPKVLGVSPGDGVAAVPINAQVAIQFNEPVNGTSLNEVTLRKGSETVRVTSTLSNGNQMLTLVPVNPLLANTAYTVNLAEVQNVIGQAMAAPVTTSFTTGADVELIAPALLQASPGRETTGVPTNVVAQISFSKRINPLTVTAATFNIAPASTGVPVAGAITVSADGQMATFTPSALLAPSTNYVLSVTNGIADMEAHLLSSYPLTSAFTTRTAANTAATVLAVSPANGLAGVPVNPKIVLQMSAPISAPSVGGGSIVVSANGAPIAGTVSLSVDRTLLTFTPANILVNRTTYTLAAGGFSDLAGNAVAPFTSSFTTGGEAGGNTSGPSIVSVSPRDGVTGVSVHSKIALTFNEPINPLNINENTLPMRVWNSPDVLAGSYSIDATSRILTFTPASPLPASTYIQVWVQNLSVVDLSGNGSGAFYSRFATESVADVTPPTVLSVTPSDGATGVGLNAAVVLTFSKALNPGTVNSNNFALLANGSRLESSISRSSDNRVVVLTAGTLPAGAVVTVVATSAVIDMAGNALANLETQFTTANAFDGDHPVVVAQRPGNGATGAPLNTSIVLFLNEPMESATMAGALHVTQNGVIVTGAVQLTNQGQVLQFTPEVPWQTNATVQIFLDGNAQDLDGMSMTGYQGSFTTSGGDNTSAAPFLVNMSPAWAAVGVPTNAVIDMQFNEPLDPASVNEATVFMNLPVPHTMTLINGGTTIHLVPNAPLAAGVDYNVQITTGLLGINGLALGSARYAAAFRIGADADTVLPAIVSVSPPNGALNVGTNAGVRVAFNKTINPITINPSTIQINDGSAGVVLDSISFSGDGQSVLLTPHAPLPDATVLTVTIAGVKDIEGREIAAQTTQFTTGTGPDMERPVMLSVSPSVWATNVPLNSAIVFQASEPLDLGTVNSNTFQVHQYMSGQIVDGSYSAVGDGRAIRFVPKAPLIPGMLYSAYASQGITDLAGNPLLYALSAPFTAGTTADTNVPQVVGVSPGDGLVGVPINAQTVIQFSAPVNVATLSHITLSGSAGAVPVNSALSNGNQTLTLSPVNPLQTNSVYTVAIAGVQNVSGYQLAAAVTTSFTTGTAADLAALVAVELTPAHTSTGVPTNAFLQVRFNKRINPLTATAAAWNVHGFYTGVAVAGAISVSADGQTSTFIPSSPLDPSTTYAIYLSGITGLEGQGMGLVSAYFTTGSGPTVTPAASWINPAVGFAGDSVTISGALFGASQGASTVSFNGIAATPTSWSDTEIVVPVPSGATSGNVVVTVNGVATSGVPFTVLATPVISGVSATAGPVGTPITITGTNFGSAADTKAVLFNGVPATPASWSDTSIVVPVPNTVTSGPITVVVNAIGSNANFVFTATNPMIGSVTPPSGGPGGTVILDGSGFGSNPQVQFNGVPASVVSSSDTSATVVIPATATSGPIILTSGNIASNGVPFTIAAPSISTVYPTAGGPDTLVAITGAGFGASQSNSTVAFNGVNAAITSWTDTVIVVLVSEGTTNGPVSVTVAGTAVHGPTFSVDVTAQLTDSLGNVSNYRAAIVDGLWQTIESKGPGCSSCSIRGENHYVYDNVGNLIAETDALGHTVSSTYDENSNVTSQSVQVDVGTTATSSYTYNNFGQVLTETDPLGNTTTNTYDLHGNLISVASPAPKNGVAPSVTTFVYDQKGELKQITDPLQHITKLVYTAGLVESITDPQGNVTSYGYDPRGNRTSVTDAQMKKTSFFYDDGSRLTSIIYPDTTTLSFTYDYRGRRTGITDQNGKTTSYAYDDADRLLSVTDAAQQTTRYSYDTEGNLLSITDASGHSTAFGYDAFGRVIQTVFPSSLNESYSYDAIGNMLGKTDRKGQTIAYVYDAVNRLTHKRYPDNTGIDYVYDLVGKIQKVNDPTGTYGFAYDNMGRLVGTSTQYAFLPGRAFTNTYSFDAASNRMTLAATDGSTSRYIYDSLNRLSDLTNSWAGHFAFEYDSLSRPTKMSRPNGVNTSYQHDSLSRVLSVLHQNGAGTLDGASYTTDAAGNRTAKHNMLSGVEESYTYDALYELMRVGRGDSTTESYSFDSVGNRFSSIGPIPYEYNSSNRLMSTPDITYLFDSNGNTASKTTANGVMGYTWDAENRLTAVILANSSSIISFKYDPFGRRIQKSSASGTTNYLYDGDDLIEVVDAIGNPIEQYAQSGEIDSPLALNRSGVTSFYEQDGLGSITSLTDSAGMIASTYTYDAYGNLSGATGVLPNSLQYTAREFDSETGLYYDRARYYDPQIGRFISEDPMGFLAGINFYTYVENHPLDATDPWGLTLCKLRLPGMKRDAYLDDSLIPLVKKWIALNGSDGIEVTFTSGFRSTAHQAGLNNHNATTPARPGNSLHEAGLAVDIAWSPLTPEDHDIVVANAEAAGLSWGGHFKKPKADPVHFFHDPGHRERKIPLAQKQYTQGVNCNKCR